MHQVTTDTPGALTAPGPELPPTLTPHANSRCEQGDRDAQAESDPVPGAALSAPCPKSTTPASNPTATARASLVAPWVKDPALSTLWLEFDPWPQDVYVQRAGPKQNETKQKKPPKNRPKKKKKNKSLHPSLQLNKISYLHSYKIFHIHTYDLMVKSPSSGARWLLSAPYYPGDIIIPLSLGFLYYTPRIKLSPSQVYGDEMN